MRKIRINIFDDDPTNIKLYAAIVSARNYEVYANDRAVVCPVYATPVEGCGRLKPCADIILTDNQMPQMTGIEMLLEQQRRGCRIDIRNKAVASADFDTAQRKIVEGLGCAVFHKPFRLNDIVAWLDDCERRVDLSLPLGVVRKDQRYPADFEMAYTTAAGDKIHKGNAVNFSEGGLCLRTDTPLVEQQSIAIRSASPVRCRNASVRWVNQTAGDSCLAGLSCREP